MIWDGNSYVEVTVPAAYKSRMCGLCGNYNHDVSDDFTTKFGEIVDTVHQFGHSWKTGSYKSCRRIKDQNYYKKQRELQRRRHKIVDNYGNKLRRLPSDRRRPRLPLIESDPMQRLPQSSLSVVSKPGDDIAKFYRDIATNQNSDVSTQLYNYSKNLAKAKHKLRRLSRVCKGDSSKWRTRREALVQCALLKSKLFKKCRQKVPVGRYFRYSTLEVIL